MTLHFSNVGTLSAGPENYLPAALPYLADHGLTGSLPLLVPRDPGRGSQIDAATLRSPTAMADLVALLPGPVYLGPPDSATLPAPETLSELEAAGDDAPLPARAVGIVDTGLAVWNRQFDTADGAHSRFRGLGVLSLDAASGAGFSPLTPGQLRRLVALGRSPDGDRRAARAMGRAWPGTIYGRHPVFGNQLEPGGVSHGTAMAALADAAVQETGPAPALYGVELPAAALLDRSGDTLRGVVELALGSLIDMVRDDVAKTRPTVPVALDIVLSYGFLGGPHDGSHETAAAISKVLDDAQGPDLLVRLLVAAGNHLQGRVHARLNDIAAAELSDPLTWVLPADDHSGNTLEICLKGESPPVIAVTDPACAECQAALGAGQVLALSRGGRIIGAVRHNDCGGGWQRIRLSLGATAGTTAGRAPSGAWQVRLGGWSAGLTDISTWVLRDDAPDPAGRRPPSRQSRLRDPRYVHFRPDGRPPIDDAGAPGCPVRRAGTASVLTTAASPHIEPVGALEIAGPKTDPAWYSGRPMQDSGMFNARPVDIDAPGRGRWTLASGTQRRFRMSGTSVAAALACDRRAE